MAYWGVFRIEVKCVQGRPAQPRKLEGPNYHHRFAADLKSLSFRCRYFVVVCKKFWNDNYLFEVELLQHFLQLRKFSHRAVRKGRMLCRRGLRYRSSLFRLK